MATPTGPVDFIPDPCSARAISGCVLDFECKKVSVSLPGLSSEGLLGASMDLLLVIEIEIETFRACLLAALAVAVAEAGCSLPVLPPDPPEIDIQPCLDELDKLKAEGDKQLGYIDDFFTIDFDLNGIPTRIRT